MEKVVVLAVAAVHSTDLPVHLLHQVEQAALAHVSVDLLEADDTQILSCDPLLPV